MQLALSPAPGSPLASLALIASLLRFIAAKFGLTIKEIADYWHWHHHHSVVPLAPQNYIEHGRLFHGFRKGMYMFPCDEVCASFIIYNSVQRDGYLCL